jgi:hypothetical protein
MVASVQGLGGRHEFEHPSERLLSAELGVPHRNTHLGVQATLLCAHSAAKPPGNAAPFARKSPAAKLQNVHFWAQRYAM